MTMLATGDADKTVKLWDVALGTQIDVFRISKGNVSAVTFSPNGRTLAIGAGDIELYDLKPTERRVLKRSGFGVTSLSFSPDGETLAAGSSDVELWDMITREERFTLPRHSSSINCVLFTQDGKTIITATTVGAKFMAPGELRFWSAMRD